MFFAIFALFCSITSASELVIHTQNNIYINKTSHIINGNLLNQWTVSPLWYTATNNGKLLDRGGLNSGENWSIKVRHLECGNNMVTVFAKNNDTIINTNVTLYLPNDPKFFINPRPQPAEIFWGKLYGDELMSLSDRASWSFVREHADSYFIHSAGWDIGGNSGDLLKTLSQIFDSGIYKFAAELGGTTESDDDWPNRHLSQWASWVDRIQDTGIILSVLGHNFEYNTPNFIQNFPDDNGDQIINRTTGLWKRVFSQYLKRFPHATVSHTSSPVWWPWGNFSGLGGRNLLGVESKNGFIDLNMKSYMDSLSSMTKEVGYPYYHFGSDVPYYSLDWGDMDEKATYQQKMLAYERYLHANNNKHMLLCMAPNSSLDSNSVEWDKAYSSGSLQEMILWQSLGGRPDIFNFESFYYIGPKSIIPETQQDTYTNTVKRAINYIKGIKNLSGELETLTLTKKEINDTNFMVTLSNTGDSFCMPTIAASQNNPDMHVNYKYYDNNITLGINNREGYVFTNLLQSGKSLSIDIYVEKLTESDSITLSAFWNPQDPTGTVRDFIYI
jgi:hypothetical protein